MEDRETAQRHGIVRLLRERGPLNKRDLGKALALEGLGCGHTRFPVLLVEMAEAGLVQRTHGAGGAQVWHVAGEESAAEPAPSSQDPTEENFDWHPRLGVWRCRRCLALVAEEDPRGHLLAVAHQ